MFIARHHSTTGSKPLFAIRYLPFAVQVWRAALTERVISMVKSAENFLA